MTSIYRGKMCVHFSELLLLKCNENALKNITQNKIKSHFFSWKVLFLFCYTAQKMKFSIKDLFGKCGQSRSFLRIWSHLLKKCLMENFVFLCSVKMDGCPYFLNRTMEKVYSNQLRTCNPTNREKIYNTLLHSLKRSLQTPWPSSLSEAQHLNKLTLI